LEKEFEDLVRRVLELMKENQYDINVQNNALATPLFLAITNRNYLLIDYLLE